MPFLFRQYLTGGTIFMWQSPSKEEDHYTFRTIPQEHWLVEASMARPS